MLGPPASSQAILSAPFSISQRSVTVPDDAVRDPYLAAFVANSCSAKPMVCAVRGSRRMSGPSMLVAPGRYGASTCPTSLRKSAPSHLDSESSVCAIESDLILPSTADMYASGFSALLKRQIDCTTARIFLADDRLHELGTPIPMSSRLRDFPVRDSVPRFASLLRYY